MAVIISFQDFHGDNTGSNPVGDANIPKQLGHTHGFSLNRLGRCWDDRTGTQPFFYCGTVRLGRFLPPAGLKALTHTNRTEIKIL